MTSDDFSLSSPSAAHSGTRAGRWHGIGSIPPTRAEAPRTKLSSEKCAHTKPGGAKEIEDRYTRQEALKDFELMMQELTALKAKKSN